MKSHHTSTTHVPLIHLVAVRVEAVLELDDVGVLLFDEHSHDLKLSVLETLVLQNLPTPTPTRNTDKTRAGRSTQSVTTIPD